MPNEINYTQHSSVNAELFEVEINYPTLQKRGHFAPVRLAHA